MTVPLGPDEQSGDGRCGADNQQRVVAKAGPISAFEVTYRMIMCTPPSHVSTARARTASASPASSRRP
jgi:hypothetical protein